MNKIEVKTNADPPSPSPLLFTIYFFLITVTGRDGVFLS